MNPTRPPVIHQLLPNEIMEVIFEEHAKLEWRAPVIDGRVCRVWRQIVLNTPRAWIYLEFSAEEPPGAKELREWLHRSGSAPLYIRINDRSAYDINLYGQTLHDLLSDCHTRIASLRLPAGDPSFFETRDFPCLQLLEIDQWYSNDDLPCMRWDSIPDLRSLSLESNDPPPEFRDSPLQLQWGELTQLEALSLYFFTLISPPQHLQSLTTLVLICVSFENAISSPITFPSLTYLSLYEVPGLTPYINAPCLVTYHGEGSQEPFSSPVPSLVEYRVACSLSASFDDVNPAWWHCSFPNVLRLTILANPHILVLFFRSLSRDLHSLPALQTIHVRVPNGSFTEQERAVMEDLVRVRGEACQMDVMLYFDTKRPYQNPMFFDKVSHCLSNDL
jgi:hypothetical protein